MRQELSGLQAQGTESNDNRKMLTYLSQQADQDSVLLLDSRDKIISKGALKSTFFQIANHLGLR
jgi:hypothetical protein